MDWEEFIVPDQSQIHFASLLNKSLQPLVGQVACGLFGISEDYEEAYLSLDEFMVKNRESTYFFKATGNSMMPLIVPGDILVVDRSIKINSGQVVVVNFNGERLCKRYIRQRDGAFLFSENSKYRPILLGPESEISYFAPVVGVVRRL
jgi:DNA polymerase V